MKINREEIKKKIKEIIENEKRNIDYIEVSQMFKISYTVARELLKEVAHELNLIYKNGKILVNYESTENDNGIKTALTEICDYVISIFETRVINEILDDYKHTINFYKQIYNSVQKYNYEEKEEYKFAVSMIETLTNKNLSLFEKIKTLRERDIEKYRELKELSKGLIKNIKMFERVYKLTKNPKYLDFYKTLLFLKTI